MNDTTKTDVSERRRAVMPPAPDGLNFFVEGTLERNAAEAIYLACIDGNKEELRVALSPLLGSQLKDEQKTVDELPAGKENAKGADKAKGKDIKGTKEEVISLPPTIESSSTPGSWRIIDSFGSEPLAHASSRGLVEVAKLLLDAGADVNAMGRHCGRTALHR